MVAELFASIVGLLGQYRDEKGSQAQLEFNEFLEWLVATNHTELKGLLELNATATIYIKALLNNDLKDFKEKLEKIDAALIRFSSAVEGFGDLARSIKPGSVLSEQALNILGQFQNSGATTVLELRVYGGPEFVFLEGNGSLDIAQPRFVGDDLQTLVECGLLRHDLNSKGQNVYIFTRAASELVSDENS